MIFKITRHDARTDGPVRAGRKLRPVYISFSDKFISSKKKLEKPEKSPVFFMPSTRPYFRIKLKCPSQRQNFLFLLPLPGSFSPFLPGKSGRFTPHLFKRR
jgi:hypothetical protein